MNTKTLNTALATLAIVLITSLALAGPGRGMNSDRPMQRNSAVAQLSQEKQDLLKTILTEHRTEVQPLRNAMWEKRTLLRALSANPNATPETLTALIKEMGTLRISLQEKRVALEERVKKEIGIDLPRHFGRDGNHRGRMNMDQRGICGSMNGRNNSGYGMGIGMAPASGSGHLGRSAQLNCPAI